MILVLDDIYTKKECNDLIKFTEKEGYSDVLTNKFNEEFIDKEFRNDKCYAATNKPLALDLLERIKKYIPESRLSVNYLLRFSKYEKGGYCIPHKDTILEQTGYRSKYTAILYLNNAKGYNCYIIVL
jgi:predicted house-cleaning noncanonical NTP pyrophosphatase (MazG superfamily)